MGVEKAVTLSGRISFSSVGGYPVISRDDGASFMKTALMALAMAVLSACASGSGTDKGSAFDRSLRIQSGMEYAAVLDVFDGLEMRRTFNGNAMALQGCSGGFPKWTDEYVTVWCTDNKVVGLTQWDDNADWACDAGFREVD